MAESHSQSQRQRAEARERRRSLASQPFEELDEAVPGNGGEGPDTLATAKHAARTAAAAAITGGLAGAAKALLDRRGRSDEETGEGPAEEQQAARETEASSDEAETESQQRPAEPSEGADDASDESASADEPRKGDDEDESRPPDEQEELPQRSSSSEVARMVNRARSQIMDLLGKEPESVSGVQHANGSWSVTVEVVEIRRIPDTTDILSSYEVVLDDDGDLVRFDRRRRYRRSQIEED